MIKIVIVDDHVLFREGLASILQQEHEIQVVGMAGTAQEAVDMACELKPDIVLMDFSLPDGSGPEATRSILQKTPNCKVVFVTMSERDEDLFAAIRSGAVGYLLKNMTPARLIASLRSVQRGEAAISRSMTLRLMKAFSRTQEAPSGVKPALAKLTARERDILAVLGSGKSNLEIAAELFISENTVKYHVHSILEKLHLNDRREAARFAKEHGLGK